VRAFDTRSALACSSSTIGKTSSTRSDEIEKELLFEKVETLTATVEIMRVNFSALQQENKKRKQTLAKYIAKFGMLLDSQDESENSLLCSDILSESPSFSRSDSEFESSGDNEISGSSSDTESL